MRALSPRVPGSRARGWSLVLLVLCALLFDLGAAATAGAHPLGNFTVNRYARVELSAGTARILYVLDLAEIPSFQARDELAADPEGYAKALVEEIRAGIALEVDGRLLDLEAVDRRLTQPDGEGGLTTTRLVVLFEAELPEGGADEVHDGRFADGNGEGRIGWREIVVTAPGDGEVLSSSVPDTDITDELRDYPEDRLRSPLDVREATFRFTAGSEAVAASSIVDGVAAGRRGDRFTELLDRQDLTPWALAGMLAVAAFVGVGHALAPGHGKTVMAAYLIGTRGRPIDAVLLGVIVSAMHTTSVLLLGLALYQVDERFALDRIYPVLTLASGVGVLLVGGWLATTRVRTLRLAGRRADVGRGHGSLAGHTSGDGTPPTIRARHELEPVTVRAGAGGHDHAPLAGDTHAHRGTDDHHDLAHDPDDHDHAHDAHGHDHAPLAGDTHAHRGTDDHHDLAHDPDDHDHAHDAHGHGADPHGRGTDDHHDHAHDPDHDHGGDAPDHGGGRRAHGHDHGPGGHSHDLPEGVAPLSTRGLVLLATAGGVVPSPSAVIVLVSAFTLGRVGLGLALVAAFSIGLAATLTAVGLALVFGSGALGSRISGRLVRVFPVIGAAALLVLGLVLTFQGVRGL